MNVTDKLIAAFKGFKIVRDGLLWFATQNPDHGLMLLLGGAGAPRFKRAVKTAQTFSIEAALREPPGLEPATLVRDQDDSIRRVGAIKVQARFVDAICFWYPRPEWFAPRRAIDGPVRAVVRGRVVAVVMGIPNGEVEAADARRRGMIPTKLEPSLKIEEASL